MTLEYLSVNLMVAKKLRSLDFNGSCIAKFNHQGYNMNSFADLIDHNSGIISKNYISAPLIAQVKQWMKEKYNQDLWDMPFTNDKQYWKEMNQQILDILKELK